MSMQNISEEFREAKFYQGNRWKVEIKEAGSHWKMLGVIERGLM